MRGRFLFGLGAAALGLSALAADVAEITLAKPRMRWLWGGFGFHNSEATMTPMMSAAFRDERVLKSFREIAPSYARLFAGFHDWTREAMDAFADYYDATFRRAGTTLYLVPGRMPVVTDGFDFDGYCARVLEPAFADADLRVGAVTNPDGSCSVAVVNWGAAKTVRVTSAHPLEKPLRIYEYDSAKPPMNAFNDLQPAKGTVAATNGVFVATLPPRSLTFFTTDYVDRAPSAVTGVARRDGALVWDAAKDPDHVYYRVYRDGTQIASTVATRLGVKGEKGVYSVRSVDRWGNVGAAGREGLRDESTRMESIGGSWRPTERWRGFNLDGKSIKNGWFSGRWYEDDLRWMKEFGFNFARVMLDYRYWTKADGQTPDPSLLGSFDELIVWGRQYGIHLQLCFNVPPLLKDYPTVRSKAALFRDAATQDALVANWAFFAHRYADVPVCCLSFNLFNEPNTSVALGTYAQIAKRCLDVIHAITPERMVVIDGLNCARVPALDCLGLDLGQSLHIYEPRNICGIPNGEVWGDPIWPPLPVFSPIGGKAKPTMNAPIAIEAIPAGRITVVPGIVNGMAEVVVALDGVELLRHPYQVARDAAWTNVFARPSGRLAGVPLKPLVVDLPKAGRLTVRLEGGDWMDVREVRIESEGKVAKLATCQDWGKACQPVRFAGFGDGQPFVHPDGTPFTPKGYLMEAVFDHWKPVEEAGQFMMVGEFGAFSGVSHEVALRWMEDVLKELKRRNIGWALWNLRGRFGIIDSRRKDVAYEDYQGHQLDRKMLELLQRY